MILITILNLFVEDGTTLPSVNVYNNYEPTYINIGSGNVFKLRWATELTESTDEAVEYYELIIKRYDVDLNIYHDVFKKKIGLVNEFYVNSNLLPTLPLQYRLDASVVAYGKLGSTVISDIKHIYVSKGTGTYVKVTPEGYNQPVMKRAVALVNSRPHPNMAEEIPAIIVDEKGNEIPLLDSNNNETQIKATNILRSSDWVVAQEFYAKNATGAWQVSDIRYEVLVDKDGNTITDTDNDFIYTY